MTLKGRPLSLLVAAAIFLAPLNLFFKWGEAAAYVNGIFSDYLVQKIWVGEIPVILTIMLWFWQKIHTSKIKNNQFFKKNSTILIMLALLGVRQYFSSLPYVSLWYFFKTVELIVFGFCLLEAWPTLHQKLIHAAILLTVLFQTSIVSLQFLRQQPLFEYPVLGETQFTGSLNIARAAFKAGEVILPYGTTAHPNIAAGIMVVLGAAWLHLYAHTHRILHWSALLLVALMSWSLFLSQSLAAASAWGVFLLWQSLPALKKHTTWIACSLLLATPALLLFVPAEWYNESFDRRVFLNAHAVTVFIQQPFVGVGLDMFTTTLTNIPYKELVRFVQPAHNIPLLWLAETGLLGGALLWVMLKKLSFHHHWWLMVLVPLLSLDHYLITQWAGAVMLVLVVVMATDHKLKE